MVNEFDNLLGNMHPPPKEPKKQEEKIIPKKEYPTLDIDEDKAKLINNVDDYPSILDYLKFSGEVKKRLEETEKALITLNRRQDLILDEMAKRQHEINTAYINEQVKEINSTLFGNIKLKLGNFYLVKIKAKKLREIAKDEQKQ